MPKYAIFITLLFVIGICQAKDKQRAWQVGTVLDTDKSQVLFGTYNSSSTTGVATLNSSTTANGTLRNGSISGQSSTSGTGVYSGNSYGTSRALYRVSENYVVQSDRYVYLTEERMVYRWSKPARLIVNAPVQFVAERDKLYLLDLDGKEHRTRILKQIQLPAEALPSRSNSAPKTGSPLTNADMVALKKAGFGDEILVAKVAASIPKYKLEPTDLVALQGAGLSDAVVSAMIRAQSSAK